MKTQTDPLDRPCQGLLRQVPSRQVLSGWATILIGTALLSACGASDSLVSPAPDRASPVTGVSPSAAQPVANPVAAGTYLFDPVHGQPIPAVTPEPTQGEAPALATGPNPTPLAGAVSGSFPPPASGSGADSPLRGRSAPARPLANPAGPSLATASIVVSPGLAIERDPAGRARLDRSSRP